MKISTIAAILLLLSSITLLAADKPNIVFILADDLGYGDVHCLNPARGKIATPNLDRLASQGMSFTDAHDVASVCTPSRYGLLTGRYPRCNSTTRHPTSEKNIMCRAITRKSCSG